MFEWQVATKHCIPIICAIDMTHCLKQNVVDMLQENAPELLTREPLEYTFRHRHDTVREIAKFLNEVPNLTAGEADTGKISGGKDLKAKRDQLARRISSDVIEFVPSPAADPHKKKPGADKIVKKGNFKKPPAILEGSEDAPESFFDGGANAKKMADDSAADQPKKKQGGCDEDRRGGGASAAKKEAKNAKGGCDEARRAVGPSAAKKEAKNAEGKKDKKDKHEGAPGERGVSRKKKSPSPNPRPKPQVDAASFFAICDRVMHPQHEMGTVHEIVQTEMDLIVVVNFDNGTQHRYKPKAQHKLQKVIDEGGGQDEHNAAGVGAGKHNKKDKGKNKKKAHKPKDAEKKIQALQADELE